MIKGIKIDGFSNYWIFPTLGMVWSLFSNRWIGSPDKKSGYWYVTLIDDNGKQHTFLLHRLIWEAVNGEIPEGMEINHTTEDKNMNGIQHLSLCTHKENMNFGTGIQRMTEKRKGVFVNRTDQSKQVAAYQNDTLIMVFPSTMEAQRQGFDRSAIFKCCNGKIPHYKNYHWKYLN